MRPQRPLKLRMRSQHPFGGRGCSYRSVGEGGARTGLLGKGGLMRPQRPLMLRMRPGILLGEGVARTGLLGEGGLMRPQRPLMLRMRPQHPFGGRGPQVWGKEFYKRGFHPFSSSVVLRLFCSPR